MSALPIVASVLLALPAVEAPAPPAEHRDPWELWMGLTSGGRPSSGSASVTGRIGASRKVGRWFRPELELGTGAYLRDEQTVSLMRVGTRFELVANGTLVPWLYAGFAHHHEVTFDDAQHSPFGAALGLSDNGEIHRSGLDLGVGGTLNLPRNPRDTLQLRLLGRASVTHLLGTGPARSIDVLLGLGVGF